MQMARLKVLYIFTFTTCMLYTVYYLLRPYLMLHVYIAFNLAPVYSYKTVTSQNAQNIKMMYYLSSKEQIYQISMQINLRIYIQILWRFLVNERKRNIGSCFVKMSLWNLGP
ncbi:hypothetical protein O6H91_Y226200 [Diphasiastrum complanatum]|nr:hypothetical protein O6H91_Y226200 [Diphasiastrum complanatum]